LWKSPEPYGGKMSLADRAVYGAALGHGGDVMEETEPVEIRLSQHCGIVLQLGLFMLQTSSGNDRRVFRLFPT
jgi:hypothetical protein